MKKTHLVLLTAILFSSATLGNVVTTTSAATTQTASSKIVVNTINYVNGTASVGTERVTGPVGYLQAVNVPKGYKIVDPSQNFIRLADGYARVNVKVTKLLISDPVYTTINYVNVKTNQKVGKQELSGVEDETFELDIPDLYQVVNPYDSHFTLIKNVTTRTVYVKPNKLAKDEITNTVQYRLQRSGIYISTKTVKGKIGDQKAYQVPDGYRLAFHQSSVYFISATDRVHVVEIIKDKNAVTTKLNFIEKGTNKTIDQGSISGLLGQTLPVDFPDGYKPVNDYDQTITMRPNQPQKAILVEKEPMSEKTYSLLVKTTKPAPLYDAKGKRINHRNLGTNSEWSSDRSKTIHDETYFRVSTSEWVKASDVLTYQAYSGTVKTSNGGNKTLYSVAGKASTRSLAPNSSWYSDKTATINGVKMYRVSTNEWIAATDFA